MAKLSISSYPCFHTNFLHVRCIGWRLISHDMHLSVAIDLFGAMHRHCLHIQLIMVKVN